MLHKTLIFILLFCFISSLESKGQSDRDTLFYEINSAMIEETKLHESNKDEQYRVLVQLKTDFHAEYERLTEENIENFLAVVYKGEILSPKLPIIKAEIPGGRFTIGPFNKEKEAQKILDRLTSED